MSNNTKQERQFLPRSSSVHLIDYFVNEKDKGSREVPETIDERENGSNSNVQHETEVEQAPENEKRDIWVSIQLFRRSIYLILSEPKSSIASAIFFVVLIIMILLSNVILIGSTLPHWSYTPASCEFCVENEKMHTDIPCICPPQPLPITDTIQDVCMFFFAVEWFLRVACYVPPSSISRNNTRCVWFQHLKQWSKILIRPSTIIDGLAVFPYFLERYVDVNGLMTLRLLRVFRLYLLLRLGSFSSFFQIMLNVFVKSLISLYILVLGLAFGAAFFGSMIYFCERGEWQYTMLTEPPSYRFIRNSVEPNFEGAYKEISPFTSIPASFWWFIVTATTVGYGDYYPTSWPGKCVACLAMIAGLVVVAFPVSIFCELWSKELDIAKENTLMEEAMSKDDEFSNEISPASQENHNSITTYLPDTSSSIGQNINRKNAVISNDVDMSSIKVNNSDKTSAQISENLVSQCPQNNRNVNDKKNSQDGLFARRSDINILSQHLSLIDVHQKEIHNSQILLRKIIQNINSNPVSNEAIHLKDPILQVNTDIDDNMHFMESKSEIN